MTPLSTQNVQRFLTTKVTRRQCAECGGSNFGMVQEDAQQRHAAIALYEFPDYSMSTALPLDLVIVMCTDCGGLRPFARDQVAQWISDNPA
jgi:hypothetical protein